MKRIFSLGESTVFDSEVNAIMQATDVLESMALSSRQVRIFTDSMSALQANLKCYTASTLVWECTLAINKLEEKYSLEFFWILVHSGYAGNQKADVLAKEAAERNFCAPEPALPISLAVSKVQFRQTTVPTVV